MRRVRAFSLGLALALGAAPAFAQARRAPEPARLQYHVAAGAAGCPDRQFFIDQVGASLYADPFTEDAAKLVTVEVHREGVKFIADAAEYDDGKSLGGRRVEARNCRDTVELIAVVVATWLRPVALPPPPVKPPEPPPPSAPASAPLPAKIEEPPSPPPAAPREPPRVLEGTAGKVRIAAWIAGAGALAAGIALLNQGARAR